MSPSARSAVWATGKERRPDLRGVFACSVKLYVHRTRVTSDPGLLVVRELDEALGLTEMAATS